MGNPDQATHRVEQQTTTGLPQRVWLASRSPRRRELLATLGVQPEVFLAQEAPQAEALEAPQADELPLPYVQRVTLLKLNQAMQALQAKGEKGIVLAADTTVALGQQILGKPDNAAHARAMLEALSGTVHQVHTAVAVAVLGQARPPLLAVQSSDVHFAHLPAAFIEHYIASGEPFDKAGAYGIQGSAGQYVRYISGSHSGIMGLPLFETGQLLRQIQIA